ncbi:MAG: hypothetical protein AMJ81_02245 [Phycisphaerae bacterium SM23_33]|nr:MAG: hypothetical protein AMJ81_02245 [Phycisphaerae bacterium SM23_33]
MFTNRLHATLISACILAAWAGCDEPLSLNWQRQPTTRPARIVIPPGVAGTVAQYADLVGAEPVTVRGYGVVVGLGRSGSSEVPPALRKRLTDQMYKHKLSSPMAGTSQLTPARILADEDTAVVGVSGVVPPAGPPNTRFDLNVEALRGTQTTSLDGGVLMTVELHMALDETVGTVREAKSWAIGRGVVFVNPFIDRGNPADKAKLRVGRILNGGTVTRGQPLRLTLREPDYLVAHNIQERLNERFGKGLAKVARGKTPAMIELEIPPAYRDDYEHFLRLVMHVYLVGGPAGQEEHARQLSRAIVLPTARREDISLVWEAMGRQVLPVIQPLYGSENLAAAFYAARAGLRLGDPLAVEPMIHLAKLADSSHQLQAVLELGRARQFIQGVGVLRQLLAGKNQLLRVAAYEALLEHGSTGAIQREDISGQFRLDIIQADADYTVYATRTGPPTIMLFGHNVPIYRPVFYCPPDELVTINAMRDASEISVYRKVPRTEKMSETFKLPPRVDELIRVLGKLPTQGRDGRPEGLGLTYSQVVRVLYGLCEEGHIPAEFVLQPAPAMRRIYGSTAATGRPDVPEEERQ